jgi:broad specificity phosphatase PhoE
MTQRRRVYLARHGAVSYFEPGHDLGMDDPPLNAAGVAQAKALGQLLRDVPIELAAHSGMERTRQTAALAIAPRDLKLVAIGGFSEAKPGNFEEIETEAEMEATIVKAFENAEAPGARFLTGESYAEVWARVETAWRTFIAEDWSHAFVAAHGVVNRTILAQALGAGPEIFRQLEQDAGCLNVLDIEGQGSAAHVRYVRLINFTPYNPTKAGMHQTTLEMLWQQFLGN